MELPKIGCEMCKHSTYDSRLYCTMNAPGPDGHPLAKLKCGDFEVKDDFTEPADCCWACRFYSERRCVVYVSKSDKEKHERGHYASEYDICKHFSRNRGYE